MSIRDSLNHLCREGQIVHLPPLSVGDPSVRHVFLEKTLALRLEHAMSGATVDDARLVALLADIDILTTGQVVSFGDDPARKNKSAFLARTRPVQDGIMALRSRKPKPGLRLFGALCERDVFLGLTLHRRDALDGRLYDNAILGACAVWDRLLPDHTRMNAAMEEMLSNALCTDKT